MTWAEVYSVCKMLCVVIVTLCICFYHVSVIYAMAQCLSVISRCSVKMFTQTMPYHMIAYGLEIFVTFEWRSPPYLGHQMHF